MICKDRLTIGAHAIFLAEASPVMASLLSFQISSLRSQIGEIKFSDLTLSEVEKVLEFIYDGSVSFDNHHDFEQFIANA